MRERDIEAHLVKRVKECGGEVRKVQWIGRRGAPDRVVMLPAMPHAFGPDFVNSLTWIELKAPGKKAEPHQLREHERMRKMGQRVLVIDSTEAVDEFIGPF